MENIIFTHETGSISPGEIKVYALSTCAFCKKALKFLREKSMSFSYVYVDDLAPGMKESIKEGLSRKFNSVVGFPFLVLDDRQFLVGFNEEKYMELLMK